MDLENIFRLSCCCPKVAYVRVCVCSHVYCLVTCWYPDLNFEYRGIESLQHTATYCNTLQHTATHCNTLQHTATHCNTMSSRLCVLSLSRLQDTQLSVKCVALSLTGAVCCIVVCVSCRLHVLSPTTALLLQTAADCNTLQHCNTMQHTTPQCLVVCVSCRCLDYTTHK